MSWMWKRALLVGAVGLIAGGAVGCAQEREAINRVQANALAKSFFVGNDLQSPDDDPEFWHRQMVVDVGYGASQDGLFSASWGQAELTRITWTIQEDLLIGRIAYERIEDTDGKGVGSKTKDGVIAVAYKILSHFDIRRAYNSQTGEESNVIEENTSDRPWYERDYMRVDWSENLNVDSYDFDTLSLIGVYGGVSYESLKYYVNDPNNEEAPHFDPNSGYFDITNKAFAKPELIDLSAFGWGIDKFPACYLDNDFLGGDYPSGNCNPVELTIRHSFRRVVNRDYEPADWDGYRFQAFGPFLKERFGYARNYGMSDTKWHRFITRYNIWERSHYYDDPASMTGAVECFTPQSTPVGADPHRDDDGNGTEDECEAVTAKVGAAGSRCDQFSQKCTLPFQKRKEVPQAWYVTNGSNPEYFDGTDWATHEWDVALRSAVMSSKYAECVRTFGGDCQSLYPVYHGQMDDNSDAISLAREVDDCRHGKTNGGKGCDALADQIGNARGYSAGVIALAKMPEMLVLCHSPVEASDPAACGGPRLPANMTAEMCFMIRDDIEKAIETLKLPVPDDARGNLSELQDMLLQPCNAALNVRMGDLRYHTVNNFKAPQTPSAWGIYTDSEDPLTGEKISAGINVWTHINDLWSQGVVDQIRYIKGELKTEDVTEGTFVRDWAAASEAANSHGVLPTLTKAQLNEKMGAAIDLTKGDLGDMELKKAKMLDDSALVNKVKDLNAALRHVKADAYAGSTMGPIYEARRNNARGTDFEAQLLTKQMQQYAGVESMPDGMKAFASPLGPLNPSVKRQISRLKEIALAERGSCVFSEESAPAPISMAGLADVLELKFGAFNPDDDLATQYARAEKMRRYVAQRAQYAVIIHEMGHSIGERHNFVSSSDAWGYRPQYWQLRTKNGQLKPPPGQASSQLCTDLSATGEDCVGPRYFDPVTPNERDNLIWMFMQQSTMDYAGEATQDLVGLGAYDFAAARMFYGDVASVHAGDDYKVTAVKGKSILQWKTDSFGGILGYLPEYNGNPISYAQLDAAYNLIDCNPTTPGYWEGDDAQVEIFRPATWNEDRDGKWHPVVDGQIVKVNGKYSRCRQQPVDYMPWSSLKFPTASQAGNFYRGGPAVDPQSRTRVPYGFATDRWADLGNLAVYRHDNGADPYELFNFFITMQEVGHVFDNYRRQRQSFSVRSASDRTLTRYNTKMRDGAKGLGLLKNIYADFGHELGVNVPSLWQFAAQNFFPENMLAAGIAFDHFTRQVARPQPGGHFFLDGDPAVETDVNGTPLPNRRVLRSHDFSLSSSPPPAVVNIPNGATGYYGDIGLGGKLLENRLSEDKGEYDSEYTINAGCYYDKVWAPMLMTESEDNFISDSLSDFVDARYRAVSLADLLPDGFRRWFANNLTGDEFIKGARIEATNASGTPLTDGDNYPASAIGWTSWWTNNDRNNDGVSDGPEVCFPGDGSIICTSFGFPPDAFDPKPPPQFVSILDPEVGWEQQKFLIAMALQYLPENQKRNWLDMMYIWERLSNIDPVWENRIEFHDPSGRSYVAKTFGTEAIFGKTVQRGIGARVLEYANELLNKAYVTTPVNYNGATWYELVLHPTTHLPIVKYEKLTDVFGAVISRPGCEALTPGNPLKDTPEEAFGDCKCEDNRSCLMLEKYVEVPFYLRQAIQAYGLCIDGLKGVYDLPSCW